eukprot:TRINITY_DN9097_c1_g1_i1.p1 TRINITY_DN9097_c1_g1~~TRINITY_DN9097_c1_g1_i1.p1  ORF type:complete len:846 (+),score=260.56 TRINITY_DN9097_c1_g1_i1:94-2631(+)
MAGRTGAKVSFDCTSMQDFEEGSWGTRDNSGTPPPEEAEGGAPCGCLWRRVVRPEDDEKTRLRKQWIMIISVVILVISTWHSFNSFVIAGSVSLWGTVWSVGAFLCAALAVTFLQLTRSFPEPLLNATLIWIALVMICSLDMGSLTHLTPAYWPIFVVVIDCALVFDVANGVRVVLLGIALSWLMFSACIYVGLVPVWDPFLKPDPAICRCDDPPCYSGEVSGTMVKAFGNVSVFLFDYYITSSFEKTMRAEQRKMKAVLAVSETVAGCLAEFDLEGASACLTAAGDGLPPQLLAAYERLVANLESYRPYLPSELFDGDGAGDAAGPSRARAMTGVDGSIPGTGGAPWAAIAFTDIRKSTNLWEMSGEAMNEALLLHNAAARAALAETRGYEVKTIGDAFMMAFHTVDEAIRCCARFQTALATEVQHPPGLTRSGLDDGFGILTVRIGVHAGPVTAQPNVLTGRYDYFGPTVNRAARVEPFGAPGAVTVTREALAHCEEELDPDAFTVLEYQHPRMGKGMKEPLYLTALLPRALIATAAAVRKVVSGAQVGAVGGKEAQPRRVSMARSDARSSPRGSYASDDDTSCRSGAAKARTFKRLVGNRPVPACVGVVKFDAWEDADVHDPDVADMWPDAERRLAQRLHALHEQLQASAGHMTALVNSVAVVSWNVQRACPQFVAESARFAVLLQQAVGSFHAGLAVGIVAKTEAAASEARRFVTLLGPCVDLAFTLCHAAADLDTPAVVAAVDGEDADFAHATHDILRAHTSFLALWQVPGANANGVAVPVHQLSIESLARATDRRADEGRWSTASAETVEHVPDEASRAAVQALAHGFLRRRAPPVAMW